MVTQVTFSPRFQALDVEIDELIGDRIEEKLVSFGNYAVEISPVYSGAFVNSWSLVPIGSGAGRSRISSYDYKGNTSRLKHPERANPTEQKATARVNIANDAKTHSKSIVEKGGAVLTNRAPHAEIVDRKYLTVTRVRDRFR